MSIEHAHNKILRGIKIESEAQTENIYISVPKPPTQLGSIGVKTKKPKEKKYDAWALGTSSINWRHVCRSTGNRSKCHTSTGHTALKSSLNFKIIYF
jgi:hypothetical protein